MFLSEIAQKYQTDDVPLVQCVIEAMQDVHKSAESWDFDNWIVIDVSFLDVNRLLSNAVIANTIARRPFFALRYPSAADV